MAGKLTETRIARAKVPHGKTQAFLWDAAVPGFGLRILAGGSKTFWFMYRPAGGRSVSSRMVRIGRWHTGSLNGARRRAKDLAGAVARGEDPAADKQEERRRASSTLRTLLAEGGDYERHLKRRHIVNTKTDKGYIGPTLTHVGSRLTAAWVYQWMKNPQALRPGTMEPNRAMNEEEARALTAFLM